jgi:hypothetical protein
VRLGQHGRIVLDTLLPANADPRLPLGVLDVGFTDFHREFERTASPSLRAAFRASLLAAIWVSPLLIRRAPPLSRLPRTARERALAAMATSRVGLLNQLLVVLKLVAAMSYGAQPVVRNAVGYGQTPMGDVGSTSAGIGSDSPTERTFPREPGS